MTWLLKQQMSVSSIRSWLLAHVTSHSLYMEGFRFDMELQYRKHYHVYAFLKNTCKMCPHETRGIWEIRCDYHSSVSHQWCISVVVMYFHHGKVVWKSCSLQLWVHRLVIQQAVCASAGTDLRHLTKITLAVSCSQSVEISLWQYCFALFSWQVTSAVVTNRADCPYQKLALLNLDCSWCVFFRYQTCKFCAQWY